jgi:predicted RNA-binding protein with RPS1 domain
VKTYRGESFLNRNIEFSMPKSEEEKFVEFIRSNSDVIMISPTSDDSKVRIINDFLEEGENVFWNKAYIALAKDVDKITMSYVKSCEHYIIEDTYEAPVIEIRKNKSNYTSNARLYVELYFYKNELKIYKGEEFEKLYKKIETWIKNNYDIITPVCNLYS